ncbi:MAG: OmpA family protein [Reyranella sp.]|uniref:OmpA family protein n=1 Tax=Reyranella sp. TaxID=1929291 RepID=UPI003D0F5886
MPALTNALRSLAVAAAGVAAAVSSAAAQGTGSYLPPPERIESRLIDDGQGDVRRAPAPLPTRQVVAIPATLPPAQVAAVPPPVAAAPPSAPVQMAVPPTPATPPPAAAPAPRPTATAALAPEPPAPAPSGSALSTIPFMPGSAILSDFAKAELDRVAAGITDRKVRGIELHAYAGDGDPDSRKVALARALVVRSYLIDRRVKARIEVGAFSGSGERVDILAPTP